MHDAPTRSLTKSPQRARCAAHLLAMLLFAACDGGSPAGPVAGGSDPDPPTAGALSCDAPDPIRVGGAEADHRTIAAALEAAPPGATVRVAPGSWPAVRIERDDVALCGAGAGTLVDSEESFGIYLAGSNLLVEGFEVAGVERETPGVDHGPTGVVIAGRDIAVRRVTAARNRVNGFLVTPTARRISLEDVVAYDNSWAGIAVGGGDSITVSGAELYNTGTRTSAEGRRQRYGILTDNVGDTREESGRISDIDGIQHIRGLRVEGSVIHSHLGYGVRVSAGNEELSQLESGRITTRDFALVDSHLYDNGSDTDDWVGGLYHHGNVLLQHVEGGVVAGNLVEGGWTWGLDAYACNGIVYRDNIFVHNDRGLHTPGVTIAPTGVEINGGRDNLFANNLVYANGAGVFSSWIPDSGDRFDRAADAHDSFDGSFSLRLENNIIVGNAAPFTEPGGEPEILVDYMEIGPESFTRRYLNNVIGTIPEWYFGGDVTALSSTFAADNPHWDTSADEIFVDAKSGDFTIRDDSPIAGTGIGPASIR